MRDRCAQGLCVAGAREIEKRGRRIPNRSRAFYQPGERSRPGKPPSARSKVPHPQKASQKAIVSAAVEIVERDGTETLSNRAVAKRLGLTPDALYRYFPDRKRLEAAVAAEGTRRLRAALQRAVKGTADAEAVCGSCRAYLRFARRRPALYAMMMKKHADSPGLVAARAGLRDFFRLLFTPLEDPQSVQTAGLAAWALLHGMVSQQREGLLDDADLSADSFSALSALVAAFSRAVAG